MVERKQINPAKCFYKTNSQGGKYIYCLSNKKDYNKYNKLKQEKKKNKIDNYMPQAKATATERKKINEMRDRMLADLLSKGVVPVASLMKSTRTNKNKGRDAKLKSIRYQTKKKAGRPKKAITMFREGFLK